MNINTHILNNNITHYKRNGVLYQKGILSVENDLITSLSGFIQTDGMFIINCYLTDVSDFIQRDYLSISHNLIYAPPIQTDILDIGSNLMCTIPTQTHILYMDNNFIIDISHFNQIHKLFLSHNYITDISSFTQKHTLKLDHNLITKLDIKSETTADRSLNVGSNFITTISPNNIYSDTILKDNLITDINDSQSSRLDLSDNLITDINDFKQTSTLIIDHNFITDIFLFKQTDTLYIVDNLLTYLPQNAQKLYASDNYITDINETICDYLDVKNNLISNPPPGGSYNISNNLITDIDMIHNPSSFIQDVIYLNDNFLTVLPNILNVSNIREIRNNFITKIDISNHRNVSGNPIKEFINTAFNKMIVIYL